MNIGIDLDEVFCEFLNPLLDFYHRKTGKRHTKEEFTEYKLWPVWQMMREDAITFAIKSREQSLQCP